MSPIVTRMVAAFAAGAAALLLSSCTSPAGSAGSAGSSRDGHTDHAHGADEPAITGAPAGYNADDVAFATNMIPHHRQAVELSGLVDSRSTDPELVGLAQQIAGAQQPEIETMKVFLVQWKENPDTDSGHAVHGGAMQGMVDDATMARLNSLSGAEFHKLWLESMISHHQGAIEMAKAELANGDNGDAKRLAQSIVDTQQAEIGQMNQMLGGG